MVCLFKIDRSYTYDKVIAGLAAPLRATGHLFFGY